jgi:hypothetical protein
VNADAIDDHAESLCPACLIERHPFLAAPGELVIDPFGFLFAFVWIESENPWGSSYP